MCEELRGGYYFAFSHIIVIVIVLLMVGALFNSRVLLARVGYWFVSQNVNPIAPTNCVIEERLRRGKGEDDRSQERSDEYDTNTILRRGESNRRTTNFSFVGDCDCLAQRSFS